MEKKSHCNCNCHKNLESIKSEDMISPIPLKSLAPCKCKNKNQTLHNKEHCSKDGEFINYTNTSFTSESPVKYGEEQDVDDL